MAAASSLSVTIFLFAGLLSSSPAQGNPVVAALDAGASKQVGRVTRADVENALIMELIGMSAGERPVEIENALRPIFDSSPKNSHGKLDHDAVRIAMHRMFAQTRGWFLKGFGSDSASALASELEVEDLVPSHLQSLLEQRVQGKGMGLQELAAMAAALEKIVLKVQPSEDLESSSTPEHLGIILLAVAAPAMLALSSYVSQRSNTGSEDKDDSATQTVASNGSNDWNWALLPFCLLGSAILLFDTLDKTVLLGTFIGGCTMLAVHRLLPERLAAKKCA